MATTDVALVLASVLGQRLAPVEAERLAAAMRPVAIEAGAPICREDEETRGLLLLLEGTAEVLKHDRERVATVEAPAVLGEMSLLTDGHHTATVRAVTPCDLALLPRDDFARLLEAGSPAAYKLVTAIAEVLARRLERMSEKVAELAGRGDAPPHVEELAAFRQKLFTEWTF
jgi:CRP/FNR family cyclic AMP-dependent transcriptional regulator